jgi:hypothetical protein
MHILFEIVAQIVGQLGLEWVFSEVEERYGTGAAWVVTIALVAVIVGLVVALITAFL